jgi:hypothetical protein
MELPVKLTKVEAVIYNNADISVTYPSESDRDPNGIVASKRRNPPVMMLSSFPNPGPVPSAASTSSRQLSSLRMSFVCSLALALLYHGIVDSGLGGSGYSSKPINTASSGITARSPALNTARPKWGRVVVSTTRS